jgi:hypothetical protein
MRLMKSVQQAAFGLLFLATAPAAAMANEAATSAPVEDARAILIASDTEKMLDFMFTQLVPLMESSFLGEIGKTESGAEMIKQINTKYPGGQAGFTKRLAELMMANLRSEYPNILEQTAKQYASEIPPADLVAIRAFMESNAGKSMAAAQPKLQQKLGAIGEEAGRRAGIKAGTQLMAETLEYLGTPK